jgi:hypothetical protein
MISVVLICINMAYRCISVKSAAASSSGSSDPGNPNVLLNTVQKAATAVGKQLTIGPTDAPRAV